MKQIKKLIKELRGLDFIDNLKIILMKIADKIEECNSGRDFEREKEENSLKVLGDTIIVYKYSKELGKTFTEMFPKIEEDNIAVETEDKEYDFNIKDNVPKELLGVTFKVVYNRS